MKQQKFTPDCQWKEKALRADHSPSYCQKIKGFWLEGI